MTIPHFVVSRQAVPPAPAPDLPFVHLDYLQQYCRSLALARLIPQLMVHDLSPQEFTLKLILIQLNWMNVIFNQIPVQPVLKLRLLPHLYLFLQHRRGNRYWEKYLRQHLGCFLERFLIET